MHNSEFEKQVQQKMQELRFAPGADVWARVQADIQKKKRRRPIVLWLLLAGLLIGGSWVFYSGVLNSNKQIVHAGTSSAEKKTDTKPVTQSSENNSTKAKNKSTENNNPTANNNSKDKSRSTTGNTTENKVATGNSIPVVTEIRTNRKANNKANNKIDKPVSSTTRRTTRPVQTSETANNSKATTNPPVSKTVTATPQEAVASNKIDNTVAKLNNDVPVQNIDTTTSIKTEDAIVKKEDKAEENLPVKKQDDAAINNKKNEKASPAKTNWQWGISAGAGISDLGQQLFKPTTVADFAYSNVTPSAPGGFNRRPSQAKAGAAWHAGGYVSKNIGKKFGLKLGLNYEYYSNAILVGSQFNSARFINQGANMVRVDEYYTSGTANKYNNKYHFVSLPLSLQWKLSDGAKRGLVWENGINLSRLVKTTALHFDGISGTYYKDDELFKNTQLMLSSSLLFTLKSKSNVQLYAGPHVQYGISNLIDDNATNQKHLRYAGLKLMVGFNKK